MFEGSWVIGRMAIFFFLFNVWGSVGVGQSWPNGHLSLCSMLMPSQSNVDAESVSSVVVLLEICPILTCVYFAWCLHIQIKLRCWLSRITYSFLFFSCIVMSIFVYYLLTYFVFLESSENSKKRKSVTSAICYSISHFGTDWVILTLFLSIHVLNFAP